MVSLADLNRLSEEIQMLFASLKLADETKTLYEEITEKLEKILNQRMKCKLDIYGSVKSGFGIISSDIDLSITLGDGYSKFDDRAIFILNLVKQAIYRFCNSCYLINARVPILKFKLSSYVKTDISIAMNNTFALKNTDLLKTYSKIDKRVRQLAIPIKHWARSRGIADASAHKLSQYAYVLLIIYFLQRREPPILPNLQKSYPSSEVVNGYECGFDKNFEQHKPIAQNNIESLGHLLVEYFRFYSHFD